MGSHLEQMFANLWVTLYPAIDLHSEYRFSPPRRYRWDFCHPASKVAIEIQGGVWMQKSGHSGGTGLLKDYEKLNLAASQGWRVFLLTEATIDAQMLATIAESIEQSELTAILDLEQIAVNSPAKTTRPKTTQRREYIGCISPKQIKGITYHYWVWRERGKRYYRCMGTDRASAVTKAKALYDPRSKSRDRQG